MKHVLLFTNKPSTSPLYKAITLGYKNRLVMGEVRQVGSGSGSNADVVEKYQVTKFPTLLVVDAEEGVAKYDG